jgi:hypothetical protein
MVHPAQDRDPDQRPDPKALPYTVEGEWPSLDDEALAQIADETWLEYDAREADQGDQVEQSDRTGQPLNEMSEHE